MELGRFALGDAFERIGLDHRFECIERPHDGADRETERVLEPGLDPGLESLGALCIE
jgi:hypothetical protein